MRRFPAWVHRVAFVLGVESIGTPGEWARAYTALRRNLTSPRAQSTNKGERKE